MPVDFTIVPEAQLAMHDRLINWGLSCRNSGGTSTAPIFRGYRAPSAMDRYGELTKAGVDTADARRISLAITTLPQANRLALSWYYVTPRNPASACRQIGCSMVVLDMLVRNGRQMLIEAGA